MKSIISKYGLAKPSNYLVSITPPTSLSDSFISDIALFIDTAEIPELGFGSEPIKHGGYGIEEQRVNAATHGNFTITVIGDSSGKVLSFFEKWMALTYNSNMSGGVNKFNVRPGTVNYPANYWGAVEVHMYDITSKQFWTHKLEKAFPLTRGSITLGWEQTDSLMKIPITFSYTHATNTLIESITNQSNTTNNTTSTNSRNINKIQNIINNPNVPDYIQRLTEV